MSYELDEKGLSVEIIYIESARHSNANLLHAEGGHKRYYHINEVIDEWFVIQWEQISKIEADSV